MPASATPYGLRPVKKLGAGVNSTGFTTYKIKSGYNTNIFQGDVVELIAGAGVEKDASTTSWDVSPLGVFMGCSYTDPNLGYKVHRNYWPASTVASDAVAYVADDPNQIFQVQTDLTGTVTDYWVGSNVAIIQDAGSTTSGMSAVVVDKDSAAATNTLPLRVVGIVDSPDNTDMTAYVDLYVMILPTKHFYSSALGRAVT